LPIGHGLELHPPVSSGDLLRQRLRPGDAVGIIDGYFHQARSIGHKEILEVMARGVIVAGAASMGALRAAELGDWGMVGVGSIVEAYRAGTLVADDEVTLVHAPDEDGYRPLSLPLINIRATLEAAVAAGRCTDPLRHTLIRGLAAMGYRHRTLAVLLRFAADSGAGPAELAGLERSFGAHPVDAKRADALALLDVLPRLGRDATRPSGLREEPTIFEYAHRLALGDRDDGASVSAIDGLRASQVLSPDHPAVHGEAVLRWLAGDCAARCGTTSPADLRSVAGAHGAHLGLYADPAAEVAADFSFLDAWVSAAERAEPLPERLLRFIVRGFRFSPSVPPDALVLAALRGDPDFPRLLDWADEAMRLNRQAHRLRPGFALDRIPSATVTGWLAERWAVPAYALEFAALDRGFDGLAGAVAAARPFYLLGLTGDAPQ
jgi:hypothetical protein